MGDIYNSPWNVKRKGVYGNQVVDTKGSFPLARNESRRLNAEAGTTDLYFIVPAGKERGQEWDDPRR